MVEAAPSPPFEMPQPDFLFEFLVVAFDPPAHLGNINELTERYIFWKRRQPVFDRFFLAIGPFNQQPFLRRLLASQQSRCATRMRTRANREDNFSAVASRHVILRRRSKARRKNRRRNHLGHAGGLRPHRTHAAQVHYFRQ